MENSLNFKNYILKKIYIIVERPMRDVTIIDVARRRSRDFAQLIDDRTDHASPTHHPWAVIIPVQSIGKLSAAGSLATWR